MLRVIACFALGLGVALAAGCGDKPKASPTENKSKPGDHDHADHGDNVVDATLPGGKVAHALLHAHFGALAGSALEVSFETVDKEPKPVTLPENTKITATVKDGDESHEVEFKPGPKKERESDAAGQCSRFEAATPWMRPNAKLTVTLTIAGSDKKVVWIDFVPNKHTHEDKD